MQRRSVLILVLLCLMTMFSLATTQAQEDGSLGSSFDINANIIFPPPVYVLRGEVQIRGTANIPGMLNYFVEFRKLNDDMTVIDEDAPWLPATLPSRETVVEEVLGLWNTETTTDGLYELRLTVNVNGSTPVFHLISPLRVENNPPDYVTPEAPFPHVTPTRPILRPTLASSPTAFTGAPFVTALTDSNVRTGDGVIYPRVAALLTGETATIVGISARGTGWYYIQLDDGRRGFISPDIVSVTGDTSDLSLINPPATPTPTFTPTPPTNGNLLINGHSTVPDRPQCNQTFDVWLNVTNNGARPTNSSVVVRIQDQHVESGTITGSGAVTVPVMQVGGNFVAVIPMTVSSFPGSDHRISATVDADFQVLEENENDNNYSFVYRLRQGGC